MDQMLAETRRSLGYAGLGYGEVLRDWARLPLPASKSAVACSLLGEARDAPDQGRGCEGGGTVAARRLFESSSVVFQRAAGVRATDRPPFCSPRDFPRRSLWLMRAPAPCENAELLPSFGLHGSECVFVSVNA